MIVADTSAWVELFRDSGHPVSTSLERLIRRDAPIAVTEVVVMELLAGARSAANEEEIRSTLIAFPLLRLEGLSDFEEAAAIYRACRKEGETIRSLLDCMIAVPAIRADAQVLHNDADFDAIARHTDLRLHRS